MKTTYCLSIFFALFSLTLPAQVNDLGSKPKEWSSIERNGMTFRWLIQEEYVSIEISAPQQGWVAIGFNTKSGLTDTHLLMGRMVKGQAEISDRYVLAPGKHQAITKLGGTKWSTRISGLEDRQRTLIRFSLPLNKADEWRHRLVPGKKYYVLMAFSRDDDFQHHSMMRTEVLIQL